MSTPYIQLIEDFTEALDLSIHDREQELSKEPLTFLVDADVAIRSVVGLTAWNPSSKEPDISQWPYVVLSLLSTGYLPRIRLLSPHLVELDRFIGRVPKPQAGSGGPRTAHLEALANFWGLAQHDAVLESSEDTVEALRHFVREEGFQVFVKLELCYGGSAYDRLLRVCRRINIVEEDVAAMRPNDTLAHRFADQIARHSKGKKATRTINNRMDGYALAELSRRVREGEKVRFYTNTDALIHLGHEDEFLDTQSRTVFRTPDYFIMRSSFPALRFNRLEAKKHGPVGPQGLSLEELRQIRDRLMYLLAHTATGQGPDEAELERTLKHPHLDYGSLEDMIDNFKRLKFLSEVFLRWELPKEIDSFVPYLKDRFQRPDLILQTRQSLRGGLDVVSEQLVGTVGYFRDWKQDYINLLRAIRDARKDWDKEPNVWRDLGLGRWGLETTIPESVKERLASWIDTVFHGEVPEQRVSDLSLEVAAKDYGTSDDFTLALCVLWSLKLYKYIVREWEDVDEAWRHEIPPGLRVLYLVSKIKSVNKKTDEEPSAVIKQLKTHLTEARRFTEANGGSDPRLDKAVGQMCVAHVAYWAWSRARELKEYAKAREFALESYQASENAITHLDEGSLMWAFAVNHSAYLGVRAKLDIDRKEEHLKTLGEVNEEHYHYRFADSRARAFTERVVDILEQYKISVLLSSTELKDIRRTACNHLRSARNLLDGGGPWFGDLEVKRHRETLDDLGRSLECLYEST